jgi:hypothetical protein
VYVVEIVRQVGRPLPARPKPQTMIPISKNGASVMPKQKVKGRSKSVSQAESTKQDSGRKTNQGQAAKQRTQHPQFCISQNTLGAQTRPHTSTRRAQRRRRGGYSVACAGDNGTQQVGLLMRRRACNQSSSCFVSNHSVGRLGSSSHATLVTYCHPPDRCTD